MPKGNPIGSKSSVVRRSKVKKRKGFKGIPKWVKERQESEPKSTATITFVEDDAVGPEDLVPPKQSASKRKINSIDETDSEQEYPVKEEYIPEGYRLIYLDSLRDLMQRIHEFSGNCEGNRPPRDILFTCKHRLLSSCG